MSTMVQAGGGGGKSKFELNYIKDTTGTVTLYRFAKACLSEDITDPNKYGMIELDGISTGKYSIRKIDKDANITTLADHLTGNVATLGQIGIQLAPNGKLISVQTWTITYPTSKNVGYINIRTVDNTSGYDIISSFENYNVHLSLSGNRYQAGSTPTNVTAFYLFKREDDTGTYKYDIFVSIYYATGTNLYSSEFHRIEWDGNATFNDAESVLVSSGDASAQYHVLGTNPYSYSGIIQPWVMKISGKKYIMLPNCPYNAQSSNSFYAVYKYDIESKSIITTPLTPAGFYKENDAEVMFGSGNICEDEDNNIYSVISSKGVHGYSKLKILRYQLTVTNSTLTFTRLSKKSLDEFSINDIFNINNASEYGYGQFSNTPSMLCGKAGDNANLYGVIPIGFYSGNFLYLLRFKNATKLTPIKEVTT